MDKKSKVTHPNLRSGITMVEMIIYIGIFAFLSLATVTALITTMKSFNSLRLTQNINQSATTAMERMAYEIRNAYGIDTANSTFGSNPEDLTLLTKDISGNPTEVEFYATSTNPYEWKTAGTSQQYSNIAMSTDGQFQTAVVWNGYIYTSSDYGVTWTQKGTSKSYGDVAISSDGKYQTAVVNGGYIFTSSDYGATWTQEGTSQTYYGIAMSSDGKYQTAVSYWGGYVFTSSDYGATWTQEGTIRNYTSIAMSSDGKYQSVTVSGGYIYISSDYGITWTQEATSYGTHGYQSIAMSPDGKYQTAVDYWGGYIYTSSDYGVTWTPKGTPQGYWGIAMSSDGRYQTAVATNGGYIFVSFDYGATWIQQGTPQNYMGIAMSFDGNYQAAVTTGYIYEYSARYQLRMKVGGVDQGSLMTESTILKNLIFAPISTPNSSAIKIDMSLQDSRQEIIKTTNFYDTIVLRGSMH